MFRRDVEIKRVFLLTGRTDMRRGISGLVSLVRLQYGLDPIEKGTRFLFCGRKKDRMKGLLFEGDGFVLASKRLSHGRYCWLNNTGGSEKSDLGGIRSTDERFYNRKHNQSEVKMIGKWSGMGIDTAWQ